MNDIKDQVLDAIELMNRVIDVNPIVRIDLTPRNYNMLAELCRADVEDSRISLFLGIPIYIVNDLPTGGRFHKKNGEVEDIEI
jgi:hypothetical protein